MIHALGPGHGKALAFTYFSSKKSSYSQAFIISFFTAFIHIVGALVLVSISIFIIEGIFSSFLDDSIGYITKTSAVLIMLLSLYILYRKLKKKSCDCCNHNITDHKNENLIFVLTAGLIPCPGTVILFVYAFILETYISVFLASIFISLGMGVVIFASSFLGVSLHKVSNKSSRFTNILEIASPIFMFLLGLFLLLNWETI
jgi:ABC-type nickel/cobalt efflux system permease component RcnA